MANELARNIQDASLNPATFTLPAAASSATSSAAIDLGADAFKSSDFELELSVPALSTTIVPDTRTVTYAFESSTTSNFAAVARTIMSQVQTGAAAGGVGALVLRARVPSNCERYVRATVTFGASTTTGAAVSGTTTVRF